MSSQRLVTAPVITIAIRYTVQRRGPGNTWHHVLQQRRDDRLAGLRRTSINCFPCKAFRSSFDTQLVRIWHVDCFHKGSDSVCGPLLGRDEENQGCSEANQPSSLLGVLSENSRTDPLNHESSSPALELSHPFSPPQGRGLLIVGGPCLSPC